MKATKPVVVIDTNILVSAFILPESIKRKAFDKTFLNCIIVFSKTTADELTNVMSRPKFDKHLTLPDRLDVVNNLIRLSSIVEPNFTVAASRDQKDDQFLELAVSANAKYIISGDKDLLVLDPFEHIKIIRPKEFLEIDI